MSNKSKKDKMEASKYQLTKKGWERKEEEKEKKQMRSIEKKSKMTDRDLINFYIKCGGAKTIQPLWKIVWHFF